MSLTWDQAIHRVHVALDECKTYEEPEGWMLFCYVEQLVKMEKELEQLAGELDDDEKEARATLAADSLMESWKEGDA